MPSIATRGDTPWRGLPVVRNAPLWAIQPKWPSVVPSPWISAKAWDRFGLARRSQSRGGQKNLTGFDARPCGDLPIQIGPMQQEFACSLPYWQSMFDVCVWHGHCGNRRASKRQQSTPRRLPTTDDAWLCFCAFPGDLHLGHCWRSRPLCRYDAEPGASTPTPKFPPVKTPQARTCQAGSSIARRPRCAYRKVGCSQQAPRWPGLAA